ncbi:hypothetical protein HDU79_007315 [Rhizoclosmatium sp. JEL0117]|nr:hypothetical protein HDU79_007315 [Rhizoclosmatium sp. JEL0117]
MSELTSSLGHLGLTVSESQVEWLLRGFCGGEAEAFLWWLGGGAFSGSRRELEGFEVLGEGEADAVRELREAKKWDALAQAASVSSSMADPSDAESISDIEAEINDLELQLNQLNEYLVVLDKQESSLLETKNWINEESLAAIESDSSVSDSLLKQSSVLENVSLKLDVSMSQVCDKVGQLVQSLDSFTEPPSFLFQCRNDLDAFLKAEERLGEEILHSYESLQAPTSDSDRDSLEYELARLTELHALTSKEHCNTLLASTFSTTKLTTLQSLSTPYPSPSSSSQTHQKSSTKQLLKSSHALSSTLQKTLTETLPALWTHASTQKTLPIHTHTLTSKTTRSQNTVEVLDKLSAVLLGMQARLQGTAIAFEVESVALVKRAGYVVDALYGDLKGRGDGFVGREGWYRQVKEGQGVLGMTRGVLDSRDLSVQKVLVGLKVVEGSSGGGLEGGISGAVVYRSLDGVLEVARRVVGEWREAEEGVKKGRGESVGEMKEAVDALAQVLERYSVTNDLIHAPKELYDLEVKLRDTANELQPLLRAGARDVDTVHRMVESIASR